MELALNLAQEILAKVSNSSTQLSKLINCEDRLQQTALMMAAAKGNSGLIQVLLDNGATLSNITHFGETVFHILAACGKENLCILQRLTGINKTIVIVYTKYRCNMLFIF